ncbi:unnamed protein product [Ectocarpus fasciculatus]
MLFKLVCKALLSILLVSASGLASAQTVQESWLRQAGITCGGGQSVDVEGQLDVAILKRLRVAGGSGEGSFNAVELKVLLEQFRDVEKSVVYKNYITCLLTTMDMATNASGLPPRDVVLESSVVVDPLQVVKRGQRVALAPGDSIAVGSLAVIFSISGISADGGTVSYNWSNSETGKNINSYASQASVIKLGDKCSLVPYKINKGISQVSLLVNC